MNLLTDHPVSKTTKYYFDSLKSETSLVGSLVFTSSRKEELSIKHRGREVIIRQSDKRQRYCRIL